VNVEELEWLGFGQLDNQMVWEKYFLRLKKVEGQGGSRYKFVLDSL
jgi:hypothetical protein